MTKGPDPPHSNGAERECGGCSVCCTVLRVDELRKLGGTPCVALASEGGCSIHPTRPGICRAYRCLWLQGAFDEADRPDRLGAVLDLVNEAGIARLAVREVEPGVALRSERLREIIERYRSFMPVRISHVADVMNPDAAFRLVLPHGEERVVEGDRVRTLRAGQPPEETRLPAFERLARRVVIAWRRFRFRNYGAGEIAPR